MLIVGGRGTGGDEEEEREPSTRSRVMVFWKAEREGVDACLEFEGR